MTEFDSPLLVPVRRSSGAFRSVLIHPTGGGLSPYLALAGRLARYGPVHGVRAAGLLPGERPGDSVAGMADDYLALLRGLPSAPDLLVGWSLGGVLAWELAARLAGTGQRPPAVVLVDSHRQRPARARLPAEVHEAVAEAARTAPGRTDPDCLRRTTDAHIAAVTGHRVTAPHRGPALLLACAGGRRERQTAEWREIAPDLTVGHLACGHFEVFRPPHQQETLRQIDAFVARLAADSRNTPHPPHCSALPDSLRRNR
ncbi:thioesterase domain-containing protein [Kitasatospora sp. NPDC002543]